MDLLLQEKLEELKNADDGCCWYLVKQPTDFSKLCYLVSFLEEYKKTNLGQSLESYISNKVYKINETKKLDISDNYRTLLVASYFGLITKTAEKGSKYEDSSVTPVFKEITKRCSGNYENISLYNDIIQNQIEKIFITTPIDDQCTGIRKDFKIFPVFYLYKILIEIGKVTGLYFITLTEYEYFVATSKKYENFLDTLLLIKLFRKDNESESSFNLELKNKFDNRMKQALKQLDTLCFEDGKITIKSEYIYVVNKKVFMFENNYKDIQEKNYLNILYSDSSLFQYLSKDNFSNILRCLNNSQTIFYGVPGSGKSHKIKAIIEKAEEDKKIINKEYQVTRVVFHPEYTNADFIGQILPGYFDGKETIDYRFSPGPFSQILRRAYLHPDMSFFLIIEEINRGNAAAIFGDIFQLLDRHKTGDSDTINNNTYTEGWSSYSVNNDFINWHIRKDADKQEGEVFQKIPVYDGLKFPTEAEGEKYNSIDIDGIHFSLNTGIRLPPNLSLLATMNTSDQNVFTLDNAFQRRWDMELVKNNFHQEGESPKKSEAADKQMNATIIVNNQYITWEDFQSQINAIIAEKGNESGLSSMEDKRLGCWFVKAENNEATKKYQIKKDVFANKVLKYLWDDAFKFCRDDIFTDKINNFEKLQEQFEKNGFDIFTPACGLEIKNMSVASSNDTEDSLDSDSVSNQENASEQQSSVTAQREE